jgi:hypothetical protein
MMPLPVYSLKVATSSELDASVLTLTSMPTEVPRYFADRYARTLGSSLSSPIEASKSAVKIFHSNCHVTPLGRDQARQHASGWYVAAALGSGKAPRRLQNMSRLREQK